MKNYVENYALGKLFRTLGYLFILLSSLYMIYNSIFVSETNFILKDTLASSFSSVEGLIGTILRYASLGPILELNQGQEAYLYLLMFWSGFFLLVWTLGKNLFSKIMNSIFMIAALIFIVYTKTTAFFSVNFENPSFVETFLNLIGDQLNVVTSLHTLVPLLIVFLLVINLWSLIEGKRPKRISNILLSVGMFILFCAHLLTFAEAALVPSFTLVIDTIIEVGQIHAYIFFPYFLLLGSTFGVLGFFRK